MEQLLANSSKTSPGAVGIVLTGGAAQIEGLYVCAQRVFHTQVRIAAPLNITGLTDYSQPHYSTAVGLLHYERTQI